MEEKFQRAPKFTCVCIHHTETYKCDINVTVLLLYIHIRIYIRWLLVERNFTVRFKFKCYFIYEFPTCITLAHTLWPITVHKLKNGTPHFLEKTMKGSIKVGSRLCFSFVCINFSCYHYSDNAKLAHNQRVRYIFKIDLRNSYGTEL